MLRQRIITALILAVVVIGSILYGNNLWQYWINLLFAIILFAATWELLSLTLKTGPLINSLVAGLFVLLFGWSSLVIPSFVIQWQATAGLCAWILIACLMPLYRLSGKWPMLVWLALLALGLDLLWISVHSLVHLHRIDPDGWILLYLLSLVWLADIGAYFSGRRFGKRKLAPRISPGKTWEGLLGGLVADLLWMLLVYRLSDGWGMQLLPFIAIGLVAVLLSVAGDLFVSILKREAGVKDSGKLLPGHGGVLDRIDSVIAASPVFLAGLFMVGLA